MRSWFAAVFALFVAGALVLAPVPTQASSPQGLFNIKPTRSQLRRLHHLDPYIRYFTSLPYGPGGARVPADYIRALILTESGGDKWAHSGKGARGLTQIIPTTGRRALAELAREHYDYLYVDERVFHSFDADHLYDPALNILIACYLSATYHELYGGRTDLVVAAWNAGPGAVRRYGNQPPPYPETRDLITRVIAYMDFLETMDVN
jgi:soluble lytic murein transglycosylase-like protein